MLLFFLPACATSDKGDTGLLWINDALTCPVEETSFTPLNSPLTCEALPNTSEIPVVSRTSLDGFVNGLPVTGQLTDDNGDGQINGQDTPDVLIIRNNGNQTSLDLLSADTLSTHWSANDTEFNGVVHSPHTGTQLTVGMAELDNAVGIFGSLVPNGKSDVCYLGRWELDGSLSWVHQQTPVKCSDTFPAISDIDADGFAEILIDGALISAETGALIQKIESTGQGVGYATDLDNDGQREWLDGTALRRSNGSPICETGGNEGIPASADLDGDGDGEFLVNSEGELHWYHHDCTLGGTWSHSTGMSQPLISDVDGDGTVEIVIQTKTEIIAFERDGSIIWNIPVQTDAPFGPSAADIDGDNISDILLAAANELYIIDGATGVKRLTYTLDSVPMAVPYALDLNGSGAPELVVTLNTGLWILEIDNGGAVTDNISRWHQRSCAVGMQGNGWVIPSGSPSNFANQNSFNSTSNGDIEANYADIHPTLLDTCTDDCSIGVVTFTISVENTGASDIAEGVSVNVLDTSGVLLHSYATEESLKANHEARLGIRVLSQEIPSDGLILSIDDNEIIAECDDSDNTIVINSNPCSP